MEGLIEGRWVHFIDDAGHHLAALVVHASLDGYVNLQVFTDDAETPMTLYYSIPFDKAGGAQTWHWIEGS